MKGIKLQKVKVSCFITILIIGLSTVVAQNEQYDRLTSEDYQLINDFYSLVDNDQPIEVYHRTYFDKGWAKYFMDIDSVLKEGTGIGTSVNDEELKRILSNDIISDIRNEIINAIPIGINSRKLSDNIKLVKSFDSKQALKDKVVR